MDQQSDIHTIALGLIVRGLATIISYSSRQGEKFLLGEDLVNKLEQNETALLPILHQAIEVVSDSVILSGPVRIEETCLFLRSPEAETLVRQIFSAKLTDPASQTGLDQIRREFQLSFSMYVGQEEPAVADSASLLFDALLQGCEKALEEAIDKGLLAAHEARSSLRHRFIRDELASIQKILNLLASQQKPNIREICDFENKYRQQIPARHGYIIPPNFDIARKLPIDDLFVNPSFVSVPRRKDKEPRKSGMHDFLSTIYRVVLLGNPGGGKSTFAHKLCNDLATHYTERCFGGRLLTPFHVVLRDFGAEKKIHSCSLLQFIEATLNANYQIQAPRGAIEYLMTSGRALVIFDGLDELLDTSYRQGISADIESFCNLYPSVPVLVTSRQVGYEQAPLDEKRFEIYSLAPFDGDQVQEYVTKWFRSETDLTAEQQKQKVDTFLKESRIVPDLTSNPLMLALICNIYRGENYIPRNRPDVYGKCAEMLFERWDKSRGIDASSVLFETQVRPSLMHLAHWIYSDAELQTGVTEQKLVAKTIDYLSGRRFEDRDEAELAARGFIKFCRGRAWVFTDTGTMKAGESLYQFTHRTFLEYFTAGHLVRTNPSPPKLLRVLLPRIRRREWDVVAQLAFQLQSRNIEGAGDKLFAALTKESRRGSSRARWQILSFAARCLEFMFPRPKITRLVAKSIIEYALQGIESRSAQKYHATNHVMAIMEFERVAVLSELLNAAGENRKPVATTLQEVLVREIRTNDVRNSFTVASLGINLPYLIYMMRRHEDPSAELCAFLQGLSVSIFDSASSRIRELCASDSDICTDAVRLGKISLSYLVQKHGISCIFRPRASDFIRLPSLSSLMMYWYAGIERIEEIGACLGCADLLRQMGRIFYESKQPILLREFHLDTLDSFRGLRPTADAPEHAGLKSLDADQFFAVFAFFAMDFEMARGFTIQQTRDALVFQNSSLATIAEIVAARNSRPEDTHKLDSELQSLGLDSGHQDFIRRWMNQEFSLTRTVKRSRHKPTRKRKTAA